MSTHCVNWLLSLSSAIVATLGSVGCSDDSYSLGGTDKDVYWLDGRRFGPCSKGADVEPIDHMEDNDATIELTEQRAGVWFSYNDKTGGTQLPSLDDETFAMFELEPPRAGSKYAVRSQGGGFTAWGAGIGFELYSQKAYDLSRYAGVTFWARRGAGSETTLRFGLADSATTLRAGRCRNYSDYSTCNDYFGVDIALSRTFERYSFSWQELSQIGWGEPLPASVDTKHVYGVRFQVGLVDEFDFVIDDIGLLCHAE